MRLWLRVWLHRKGIYLVHSLPGTHGMVTLHLHMPKLTLHQINDAFPS